MIRPATVLLLATISAGAAPLVVRPRMEPSATPPATLTVIVDGAAQSLRTDTDTTVDVGPGVHTVSLAQKGYWAQSLSVYAGPDGAVAELRVHREAIIRGRVVSAARAMKIPELLSLRFASDGFSGETSCRITGRKFSCSVPAVRLNLSFKAPGCVARYRWDVDATSKNVDAGTIELRAGSSLVGYIADGRGALVTLQPRRPGQSDDDARQDVVPITATANDRGFFHFDGIAPGEYLVSATLGDEATPREIVRVIADAEAELRRPLVLQPPHDVEVALTPKRDPYSRNWIVQLQRQTGIETVVSTERMQTMSGDGRTTLERIPAGRYVLIVQNEAGDEYIRRELSVPETTRIDVVLGRTLLRGTVTIGGKPLPGVSLAFHGEEFAVSARANAAGRFAVMLPKQDLESLRQVSLRSEEPHVSRVFDEIALERGEDGARRLDLELPGSFLAGEVVDLEGKPVSPASVRIASADGTSQEVLVRDDGTFDIHGLMPGTLRLRAFASGRRSSAEAVVMIASRSEDPAAVRLTVRGGSTLSGIVTSPSGPVPGAVVYAFPVASGSFVAPHVATGADGRYSVSVPHDAAEVDFIVNAPGFAKRVFRHSVAAGDLDIAVQQMMGDLVVETSASHDLRGTTISRQGTTRGILLIGGPSLGVTEREGRRFAHLRDLEPGDYTVCQSNECVTATLAPFAVTSVPLNPR